MTASVIGKYPPALRLPINLQAAKEMISNGGPKLLQCIPFLIRPMSLGAKILEDSIDVIAEASLAAYQLGFNVTIAS